MKTITLLAVILLNNYIITAQIPSYLPTDSLQGWWPFSGNANDESGNGNSGAVHNANLIEDRFGNLQSAYAFNGVDSYIRCLYAGPTDTTARTFSFWMKADSLTSTADNCILSYGENLSNANGKILTINYNGVMCPGIGLAFGGNLIKHQKPNTDSNQWIHSVFVIQNRSIQSVKMYRNGLLQEACFASPDIYPMQTTAQNPITFGVSHDLTIAQPGYFKGNLDDIAIWNRQLSDAEILQLYTDTKVELDESVVNSKVVVSPNPFDTHFAIEISESLLNKTFFILDLTGKTIYSSQFNSIKHDCYLPLKAGCYFLRINDSESVVPIHKL